MRAKDILTERSTLKAYSRYERNGETFYIRHRIADGGVLCEAYVAGKTLFEPVREKIANSLCSFEGQERDGANGRNVVPWKSFVEARYRRYGVYSAMLDHLEANGYIVYPANGEIGDRALQAQSDDAKAFWAKRKLRADGVKLTPVSQDEFESWGDYNPYTHADMVGDMPVLDKEGMRGYPYPLLILWQKDYSDSIQKVGVAYYQGRGLRIGLIVEFKKDGHDMDDFPLIRGIDEPINYFYDINWMRGKVKATTDKAVRALYGALTKIGYTG